MANYSLGRIPIPDVANGHTFTGDNFSQLEPHTALFTGKTGLTFIDCNCTNCDMPPDTTFIRGLHVQLDFCSNKRPELIAKGLAQCAANCSHVVDTDVIIVDGVVVDTIYHYEETIL